MKRGKRKRRAFTEVFIDAPPQRRPKREVRGILALLDDLAAKENVNREGRKR